MEGLWLALMEVEAEDEIRETARGRVILQECTFDASEASSCCFFSHTCPEHLSSPDGSTDVSQCARRGSYAKQESSDSFMRVGRKSIA